MSKARVKYLVLILIVIILGISSRKIPGLPGFIVSHFGDALWTANVYFFIRLIWPGKPVSFALLGAVIISFLVEITQLYQAPWINAIRSTYIGALVLGSGFLWIDLIRYIAGGLAAAILDYLVFQRK